jgi:hypothetical protein
MAMMMLAAEGRRNHRAGRIFFARVIEDRARASVEIRSRPGSARAPRGKSAGRPNWNSPPAAPWWPSISA